MVTSFKKLKISSKLFVFGKMIDLPVRRESPPPPLTFEDEVLTLHNGDGYEKLLLK